jgi:hypothetical protein
MAVFIQIYSVEFVLVRLKSLLSTVTGSGNTAGF